MATIPLRIEEILEQQKIASSIKKEPVTRLAQLIEEDKNRFTPPTTWE
jgi:hypothetical protein